MKNLVKTLGGNGHSSRCDVDLRTDSAYMAEGGIVCRASSD
jgi:hypothetical protein